MTYIKTPLRWPGGKSKALKTLIPHVPRYETFIEAFLGGGSMFLRLAQLHPDKNYWINDLDTCTFSIWNILYNRPDDMINYIMEQKLKYQNSEEGRELHSRCRKEIELVIGKDEFLTACYGYILNKTSFSGLTRIGSYAPQAFTSNFSINCITNLSKVSELMHSVKSLKITNLDYTDVLQNTTPDTFIFLDPPYDIKDNLYGNNGDMHRGFNHQKFADDIKQVKTPWMITYNDNPTIRQWFSEYQCIPWGLQYTMKSMKREGQAGSAKTGKSGKKGKELLILNYA